MKYTLTRNSTLFAQEMWDHMLTESLQTSAKNNFIYKHPKQEPPKCLLAGECINMLGVPTVEQRSGMRRILLTLVTTAMNLKYIWWVKKPDIINDSIYFYFQNRQSASMVEKIGRAVVSVVEREGMTTKRAWGNISGDGNVLSFDIHDGPCIQLSRHIDLELQINKCVLSVCELWFN